MSKHPGHFSKVAEAALEHFATLLRVQRKERNWKLEELADRLGVSIPTVRKMLEGSPRVAIGTYFEAAYLLGVSLFDPNQKRFALMAAKTLRVDNLLPQRIRTREEVIDDNF